MSTVTLRDALDDLERNLAAARAATAGPGRSGVWLYADDEEDQDDLYGEDDLGFDDIDEVDDDDLDDLDDEDLDDDEADDED